MIDIAIGSMYCIKTTEMGEDEIYIVHSWERSDGSSYASSGKDVAGGPWDVNDNDDKRLIAHKVFVDNLELEIGQWIAGAVFMMEDDDSGQYPDALSSLARGLAKTGDPYAMTAAAALSLGATLLSLNSDDLIGAFGYRVERTEQGYRSEVSSLHSETVVVGTRPGWTHSLEMRGDGSEYLLDFHVNSDNP